MRTAAAIHCSRTFPAWNLNKNNRNIHKNSHFLTGDDLRLLAGLFTNAESRVELRNRRRGPLTARVQLLEHGPGAQFQDSVASELLPALI